MRAKSGKCAALLLLAGASVACAGTAAAQDWKPTRNVEIVIGSSPNGSNDIAGRTVQRLWSELKLVPGTSSVTNRSGAEHALAYTYVSQRPGDGHTVGIMSTPILLNPIAGRSQLTHDDVTPLAYLFTEPMIVLVRADSPIKTGKELVDALRTNAAALSIALTSTGHRISIGMPLHQGGVAVKGLRMPAFKGGGELVTAVMGGHTDLMITSVSTSVPHISAGKMRGIAVNSSTRLGGVLAQVPTWAELGFKSSGSWKGVMGPKNMTPAQIAYWEDVLRRTSESDELRRYADQNFWLIEFKGAADTKKWLDDESAALKTTMTELGLVK